MTTWEPSGPVKPERCDAAGPRIRTRRLAPRLAMLAGLLVVVTGLGIFTLLSSGQPVREEPPPGFAIWLEVANRLEMTIMVPHYVPPGFSLPATFFSSYERMEVPNPWIAPGDQVTVRYMAEDGRRISVYINMQGDLGETPVQVVTMRGHRARLFETEIAQAPPHIPYVFLIWNEPSPTGEAIPYAVEATGLPAAEVIRMAESMRPTSPQPP